jgi:protein TonB
MEIKKKPKADLQQYKLLFFLFGLALSLGLILTAFEWESSTGVVDAIELDGAVIDEDMTEITRQEQPEPEKVENKPQPTQVAEKLVIVEDTKDLGDDDMDFSADTDESDAIVVENDDEEEVEVKIFVIVEKMPEFPGGDLELRKYIAQNIKYPNIARENDIQGKVYVRFVVTETGSVENVQIARGVDPLLDKEAIRVVESLPKWKPGEQGGKKVKVWYTVPINFQLQ